MCGSALVLLLALMQWVQPLSGSWTIVGILEYMDLSHGFHAGCGGSYGHKSNHSAPAMNAGLG